MVQGIPQAVTQQVEGHHDDAQYRAGEQQLSGIEINGLLAKRNQNAQADFRCGQADAQEAQTSLGKDKAGDGGGSVQNQN